MLARVLVRFRRKRLRRLRDVVHVSTTCGEAHQAKKSPGGGTWNFGSEKVTTKAGKQKKCYSHYFHRTKRHSGSAIIGSVNVTKTASKGKWANANAYGKRSQTCKTKWSANA